MTTVARQQTDAQTGALQGFLRTLSARFMDDPWWAGAALAAAVLMLAAAFMPLWKLELKAPQYPQGLYITAYGFDMTGDLREINALNHYVGVKPIEPGNVVELKLFPFGVAAVVAVLAVGAFCFRNRKLKSLAIAAAWSVPVVMAIDLQYWLYNYGHNLDPTAALTLDPFTPKFVGTTKVMNFHSVTMVTYGFWVMILSGLVVSLGPRVARFLRDSWTNTGQREGR